MLGTALKYGFSHYLDFASTTPRHLFWYWVLANVLIGFVIGLIDALVVNPALGIEIGSPGAGNPLGVIYALLILLPSVAMAVRRLRDAGYSPWLLLIGFIPVVNLILIYFYVQPSSHQSAMGSN